jgi:hypothetical protein
VRRRFSRLWNSGWPLRLPGHSRKALRHCAREVFAGPDGSRSQYPNSRSSGSACASGLDRIRVTLLVSVLAVGAAWKPAPRQLWFRSMLRNGLDNRLGATSAPLAKVFVGDDIPVLVGEHGQ